MKKKVILGLLAVFVIAGAVGAFSSGNKKGETTAAPPASGQASVTQPADYQSLNYADVARKPDDYKGKLVTFYGKVIQAMESTSFGTTTVTLRINADGDYDKTWYVTYKKQDSSEGRILDNDTVTVFGTCEGVKTYETVLGTKMTIPSVKAEKIELGKSINGKIVAFDVDKIIEGLKVTEYTLEGSWSRYYFVAIENPSVYDIDLSINVKYYDKDGNLSGVNSINDSIQAGGTALLYDTPDDEFASTKLEYEVKESSWTKPLQSELSYEIIQKSDKLIVTVKNNAEVTAEFVKAQVLFFDGDQLVNYDWTYVTDSDNQIKPGKEVSDEISCKATFDSYLIFVSGRK